MAGFAARLRMFADQREAGHGGMIKTDRFPGCFIVTAGAIGTVSALVGIVASMTGVAGYRRLCNLGCLFVAARTDCFAMRTLEGEAGHLVMIEIDLLP